MPKPQASVSTTKGFKKYGRAKTDVVVTTVLSRLKTSFASDDHSNWFRLKRSVRGLASPRNLLNAKTVVGPGQFIKELIFFRSPATPWPDMTWPKYWTWDCAKTDFDSFSFNKFLEKNLCESTCKFYSSSYSDSEVSVTSFDYALRRFSWIALGCSVVLNG